MERQELLRAERPMLWYSFHGHIFSHSSGGRYEGEAEAEAEATEDGCTGDI
jgi:hypothetical protein